MKKLCFSFLIFLIGLTGCFEATFQNDGSNKNSDDSRIGSDEVVVNVGFKRFYWTDYRRSETLTAFNPFDKRKVMVDIYYPTNDEETGMSFNKDRLLACYMSNFIMIAPSLCEDDVRVTATKNADIMKQDEKYPVLLYHAGFGGDRNENTTLVRSLVKSGYVVVAMASPYNDGLVYTTGGYAVTEPLPQLDINSKESSDAFLAAGYNRIEINVQDAAFIISKIKEKNDASFDNMLAVDNIGYYGMSLGGSSAIYGLKKIADVKAAVNLDGGINHQVLLENGVNKPLFFMISEGAYNTTYPYITGARGQVDMIWDKIPHGNVLVIKGSNHINYALDFCQSEFYTDFEQPICGSISTGKINQIVIAYTKAFFDLYLKDKYSSILEEVPENFPEIYDFRSK